MLSNPQIKIARLSQPTMPIGVEEVTATTTRRRTARLDTEASRRLIDNALGLRTAGSSGTSSAGNKAASIMSTPARRRQSRSKGTSKKSSATKSGGRKSKASDREEQQEIEDQHMAMDEEDTSTFAQVDESIDNLNSVLRRYIPIESNTAGEDESNNDDGAENAWEDPIKAFGDIQEARDRMMDACNKHEKYLRSQQRRDGEEEDDDDDDDDNINDDDEEFRALHMATMTTAFAAELDDIRTGRAAARAFGKKGNKRKKATNPDNIFVDPDHMKEDAEEEEEEPLVQENIDVDVLVDILQGGMRSFTANERKILIEESKRRKDSEEGGGEDGEGDIVTPHERRRKMLGF